MGYTNIIRQAAVFAIGFTVVSLSSCTEEIEVNLNDTAYNDFDRLSGYVLDEKSGKTTNIVELRSDEYSTSLKAGLNRPAGKGVDLKLEYDSDFDIVQYNIEHETDFKVFPETFVAIENDGSIVLSPKEKSSYSLSMTIKYDQELEDNATYLLPVKAIAETEGIDMPQNQNTCIYIVKNYRNLPTAYKGENAKQTFLFFEVGDTNPLNALEFKLENGAYYFDFVVLFAANINHDVEGGRAHLTFNPDVKYLLEHNEEYIQPLRKRGIKVLLGLLGNGDDAGLAQLSEVGARDFARELKVACESYNLDGVNFDDEWSLLDPDTDYPLWGPMNPISGARMCYEAKRLMPDKYITVFAFGDMYDHTDKYNDDLFIIDGVHPKNFMDIVVGNYNAPCPVLDGLPLSQVSGYSVELQQNPGGGHESQGKNIRNSDYGYHMMFALFAAEAATTDVEKRKQQIGSVSRVCQGLYEQDIQPVTGYWPERSLVRQPIDWTPGN